MISGQVIERDVGQLSELLTQAYRRSLRRLADWGPHAFPQNEKLLSEAENLEYQLTLKLHTAIHVQLTEEFEAERDHPEH